jgi:hypothetical protein
LAPTASGRQQRVSNAGGRRTFCSCDTSGLFLRYRRTTIGQGDNSPINRVNFDGPLIAIRLSGWSRRGIPAAPRTSTPRRSSWSSGLPQAGPPEDVEDIRHRRAKGRRQCSRAGTSFRSLLHKNRGNGPPGSQRVSDWRRTAALQCPRTGDYPQLARKILVLSVGRTLSWLAASLLAISTDRDETSTLRTQILSLILCSSCYARYDRCSVSIVVPEVDGKPKGDSSCKQLKRADVGAFWEDLKRPREA